MDLGLRLLVWQEELFPTLLVVQGGQLFMRPWIIRSSGFYLSPVSEGAHIETILPLYRYLLMFPDTCKNLAIYMVEQKTGKKSLI